jgi:hypothetical protein
VGLAASRARLHWVATEEDAGPEHGDARSGTVREGPVVTVASALRGAVEVRAVRIDSPCAGELELSGWPVAAGEPLLTGPDAQVSNGRLTSSVTNLAGFTAAAVRQADGTSPLGEHVAVPFLRATAEAGEVYVAAVVLRGAEAPLPTVTVTPQLVTIRWPDGAESRLRLP